MNIDYSELLIRPKSRRVHN